MATAVVACAPAAVLLMYAQRFIASGITGGAIKEPAARGGTAVQGFRSGRRAPGSSADSDGTACPQPLAGLWTEAV
jgi:hypothetical protein